MNTAIRCILSAGLACGAAFTAVAQDATVAAASTDAERAARAALQDTADTARSDGNVDRHCLQLTGSRIVAMRNARRARGQKHCIAGPGHVYTSEDIKRTGAADLATALRQLDPTIP